MQSGRRVKQSSPTKQESRHGPLLEWSEKDRQRNIKLYEASESCSIFEESATHFSLPAFTHRVPTRTCQDAKRFLYLPTHFILHSFSVESKSWLFWELCKNNSCRGASGNTLSCLSFLPRPFQRTSPGLSHKPAILYHWCRGHTVFCNIIPHFLVPSILHIPGPASSSSDLWRQRFFFRKKCTKTGTTERLQSALAMIQHCKLQLKLNSLHQPAGLKHSLGEIPNRGTTTSSIKQNFPAGWLRYG